MSRASTSFLWRLRRKTWMARTSPAMTLNRHCEPTGRREAPPDDRFREAIHAAARQTGLLRRFAPRNDEWDLVRRTSTLPRARLSPLSHIRSPGTIRRPHIFFAASMRRAFG